MKGGEEMKISKRAGNYVTVRDLIDEVGRDAVRFFLVSRKADTEFVFDIDLAKIAVGGEPGLLRAVRARARLPHARGVRGRVFRKIPRRSRRCRLDAARRARASWRCLARLGDFPDVLDAAADELAPHQVAFYLRELAGEFHSYYNAVRVLVPESDARLARLALSARRAAGAARTALPCSA